MSTVLCITGMHRSGTSLLASWLERCGVVIHDGKFWGPEYANPRGHFEDREFADLQGEAILQSAPGSGGWRLPGASFLRFNDEQLERAARLIETRDRKYRVWGWKDPRSVAFLPQWKEMLPALRVVLVWRPAGEVVSSLVARSAGATHDGLTAELFASAELWADYNRRVCAFKRMYPQDTLLFSLSYLLNNDQQVIDEINRRLEMNLRYQPITVVYDTKGMHRAATLPARAACASLQTGAIERELLELSDFKSKDTDVLTPLKDFEEWLEATPMAKALRELGAELHRRDRRTMQQTQELSRRESQARQQAETIRSTQAKLQEQDARIQSLEQQTKVLADREAAITQQRDHIAQQERELADRESTISRQQQQITEQQRTLSDQHQQIAELESALARQRTQMAEQARTIEEQRIAAAQLEARLTKQTAELGANEERLAQLTRVIEDQQVKLAALEQSVRQHEQANAGLLQRINEQADQVRQQDARLRDQDGALKSQAEKIQWQREKIKEQKTRLDRIVNHPAVKAYRWLKRAGRTNPE